MDYHLNDLTEGILNSAEWNQCEGFVLQIEDGCGKRQFEVIFSGVKLLKIVAALSTNDQVDNEIWKLEEVANSPLLQEVVEEKGVHWLCQTFGDKYQRTSSVRGLCHLRHIVLLSDYLDLELLCSKYSIQEVAPTT